MEKQAKVVQLKTQLVKEGHTRYMLAETDLMSLRIHCYAPGIGENALHAHTKEDHIFVVLDGTAQFTTGRDGKTVVTASKNHAIVLPAGCYYQFCNSGTAPLVMARIGAGSDKADQNRICRPAHGGTHGDDFSEQGCRAFYWCVGNFT